MTGAVGAANPATGLVSPAPGLSPRFRASLQFGTITPKRVRASGRACRTWGKENAFSCCHLNLVEALAQTRRIPCRGRATRPCSTPTRSGNWPAASRPGASTPRRLAAGQPAPGGQHREGVHRQGPVPGRPDRRGRPWPVPRRRRLRPQAGHAIQHVCDLLDQAGHAQSGGEYGQHGPPALLRRGDARQVEACRQPPARVAQPPDDRGGSG